LAALFAALFVAVLPVAGASAAPSMRATAPAVVPAAALDPTLAQQRDEGGADDDLDDELVEYLAAERDEADRLRRRGLFVEARRMLDALVAEAEEEGDDDLDARALRAQLELDAGRFEAALADARFVQDSEPAASGRQASGLELALTVELATLAELGRGGAADDALARLDARGFPAGVSAPLDWQAARLCFEGGRREAALVRLAGARAAPGERWDELLAQALAARRLGDLVGASQLLVKAARASEREPLVLAELAALYLEADGEVASAEAAQRNPEPLLLEARASNPACEAALLGLWELYRLNWQLSRHEAAAMLAELLAARPDSIDGRLALAEQELLLGDFAATHATLAGLVERAPDRRAVRTLAASLAALEAPTDVAESPLALLDELERQDPVDSEPARVVGTRLVELYRFVEGREVLERAVAIDAGDWRAWTALGRARANTGDVPGARDALAAADRAADLRKDVVRANLARVLRIVDEQFVEHEQGELTFAWRANGADLLELYFVPFYAEARAELSERYGYATGKVRIEVFDRHGDFSVRSTGYEGFPALGVCFGPVVTAVSPLSELRGSFSWARTGYHEFTHVVHLGLSHNRCPRWVTEGLATWEEVEKRSSWTRNMRSDLVDARANGLVFPVRELNSAFRGPRVVFGYYQGGLLCDVLIERHGFPAMLRLLDEFDRGSDLDTALARVFDRSPEQLDVEFAAHVDAQLAGLAIEPNWDLERLRTRWLTLPRSAPAGESAQREWADDWLDLAFASWQAGLRPDAEEALRIATAQPPIAPRALFLRGLLAIADGDSRAGERLLTDFIAAGGDDFRARLALAQYAGARDDVDAVEEQLLAAERAYPGHPEAELAAELALAKFYGERGRVDDAMAARERWIVWNADDWRVRMELARWHVEAGRHARAAELFEEANEVEPFQRGLHLEWARALGQVGRHAEVLRECTAFERVPVELDAVAKEPASERERAEVHVLRARALLALDRADEARAEFDRARELAPSAPFVRALAEELER
jgi:Flp pilus assembly protein TadD